MIDASAIATGLTTAKLNEFISKALSNEDGPSQKDILIAQLHMLKAIADSLSQQENPPVNETIMLFPTPAYYLIPEHEHNHVSLFLNNTTPLQLDIPERGIYQVTAGPGWVQVDQPPGTRISTTDGNSYTATVSYRDDAIGSLLLSAGVGTSVAEQSVNLNQLNGATISGMNPVPVSGSFSFTPPAQQNVNLDQLNGTAIGAGNPVPVQQQGNVSIANFPATQPVSIAQTVNADIAAASGAIVVSPVAGTAIVGAADTTVTFAQQVNHVAIENNSSNIIQFELDATTGASSLHLSNVSPGNLILLDVKCTVLHVLSAAATVLNGASGINVRGWL